MHDRCNRRPARAQSSPTNLFLHTKPTVRTLPAIHPQIAPWEGRPARPVRTRLLMSRPQDMMRRKLRTSRSAWRLTFGMRPSDREASDTAHAILLGERAISLLTRTMAVDISLLYL